MQLLVLFSKGYDRNNSFCHEGLGLDLRRTVLAKENWAYTKILWWFVWERSTRVCPRFCCCEVRKVVLR